MSGARRWQCLQDACRQSLARRPDLDCNDLVSGGVVVDQAPVDLLADDAVGVPRGKPRYIGLAVVIGKSRTHGFKDSFRPTLWLSAISSSQRPRAYDARCARISSGWVVVDNSEFATVGSHAVDTPVRIALIDLAHRMTLADRILDLRASQPSFSEAKLGMVGPDEAFDRHEARSLWDKPSRLSLKGGRGATSLRATGGSTLSMCRSA